MSIRNIYNIIIITFVFMLFNGCQKPKLAGEDKPESNNGDEQVARRFNPLELSEDKEIIPDKHPVNGVLNSSDNLIISNSTQSDDNVITPNVNITSAFDTANSQAFRIQILTSKVYGDVRRAKMVAEEIFDRLVYLDYEVPYYKIRVGSFADRDSAEDYLQQVRVAGYNDAWIVVTNVDVKILSPLYDDEPLPLIDDSLSEEFHNIESDNTIEKTVTDE